ncbi:MAG TPA: nitroreductase/quinone reductase family protein [Candidatus Limnocylindrales bacterium]|nr:nitroreductase/quinone reductase family protein [Candidatus Limnocylindrales bacterium]
MSVNVPPSGSRGMRFPRFLARLGNRFMVRQFRRGGARTRGGVDTLMLETVGAKSGNPRQAVLGYLPEGDDAWLVIAALAGAARHPAWLHNLAAEPEAVVQFADGRRVDVHADTLEGDDLAIAWERIANEAPEFVGYRTTTDREIPVVRLTRS